MIALRFSRLLLIGLFLILGSQVMLAGWTGDGIASAASDPLPSRLPIEPVEPEEPAEEDDDRSSGQMELLAAGYQLPTELPMQSLSWRASNDRDLTLLSLLFRPPTLL